MEGERLVLTWKGLSVVAFWLGMFARVFLPYLKAYWEEGGQLPFDWAYVKGQLVGSIIAFFGLMAAGGVEAVSQVGALGVGLALFAGYYSAQIGREGQKFAGAGQAYIWQGRGK